MMMSSRNARKGASCRMIFSVIPQMSIEQQQPSQHVLDLEFLSLMQSRGKYSGLSSTTMYVINNLKCGNSILLRFCMTRTTSPWPP